MPTYQPTPQFAHGQPAKTGVLIVNLGTPDAPTAAAVRRFLRQFLWDPRVIEYPRVLWWLILHLVILRIRPGRSAAAYQKIWTAAGSPLLVYSQALATKLATELGGHGDYVVDLAMSYGDPNIDDGIDNLLAEGARRILVLPLYPQYSGTTTASVFDAVARKLGELRWLPELRFVNNYHDSSLYIHALANRVRAAWAENGRGEKLLMSFHGVPKSTLTGGDPYHCQCRKTARLLANELELSDDEWVLAFQSRVGREEWLQPYTEQTLMSLATNGVKSVDVVCPGFSVDCLETLEEIALQDAELFRTNGGEQLNYVPALNDDDAHVQLLSKIVADQTHGWQQTTYEDELEAQRQRAIQMGAAS